MGVMNLILLIYSMSSSLSDKCLNIYIQSKVNRLNDTTDKPNGLLFKYENYQKYLRPDTFFFPKSTEHTLDHPDTIM